MIDRPMPLFENPERTGNSLRAGKILRESYERFSIEDDAWEEFCEDLITSGLAVFSSVTVDGVCRLSIERNFWKRDPEAKR